MSRVEFTLTFDASPTNVVEVSVGADENRDGRLSSTEAAENVKWKMGNGGRGNA